MTTSTNTIILEQALNKLKSDYFSVFQTSWEDPTPAPDTQAQTFPFNWEAIGKTVIEQPVDPQKQNPNFTDSIAYFESPIDARFTAMMWRVMPIVWSILPHSIKSAHASDVKGEPVEGPAVEMAKAILGPELAPLLAAIDRGWPHH